MMHKLDAIGDRDLRITLLFARTQQRPVTADDVAGAHKIHRNVARARLERLVDAGLLVSSFERRTGRTGPGSGRPAKTYRVAPELAALQFPERHYERLIGLVADALPQRARLDRVHEIGIAFGRDLARQARLRRAKALRPALERLCSALGRLGYQATLAEIDDDGAVITTPTCPLRPLIKVQPELAELDRGMWAGLLATALERTDAGAIVCETADSCRNERADCRIRLSLEARRPGRG